MIIHTPIVSVDGEITGHAVTVSEDGDIKAFKEMLLRAVNVWPDAPNEIKKLHDRVVHGMILQDYDSMPKLTRREELAPSENMKLDSWSSENSEAGE